ncbi:alpha/beta fold hydrolase [Shinella sp.]|uniref:alpha/beta fold hydrolase n=1 Tax=Shinella sp. TaxID=1870904 RepID=UPI003D2D2276
MLSRTLCLIAALLMTGSFGFFASFAVAAPKTEKQPVRVDVGGFKLNSVLVEQGKKADLPPIVFIHGASASLYDPIFSFRAKLQGRAKLLFVDRPGHGNSDIGSEQNILPDGQADAIAMLMKKRGIAKAIIVGHSFGGAIAASFAVRHPDMVSGLVFLSPAVYSWKGGIAWYYRAASAPVTGALFSTLIVPPIGIVVIDRATKGVFAPNPVQPGYLEQTRARQALRPVAFWHNAREVAALSGWAKTASANYRKIKAPTVIITGDTDEIVSPEVHSRHLARDIRGARLIVVHNLGHKSDFVASDLAIAAIETVAGRKANMVAAKRDIELRIANDGKD